MEDKKQLLNFVETDRDSAPPPYTPDVSPVTVHAEPESHHYIVADTVRFDRNLPQYRTCCCHVTVGSMVFAILDLIFAKLTLVSLIISLINSQRDEDVAAMIATSKFQLLIGIIFVFTSLQIIFSWMMLYGIRKGNNCLLVPDIVLKGLYTVSAALFTLYCVWMLVVSSNITNWLASTGEFDAETLAYVHEISTAFYAIILAANILAIVYYSYYFHVLKHCFRFLGAKRQAELTQSITVYKVEMAGDINKSQRF